MAFRQADGAVVWQSGDFLTSQVPPILIEVAGEPQLVIVGGGTVNGLDPASGEMIAGDVAAQGANGAEAVAYLTGAYDRWRAAVAGLSEAELAEMPELQEKRGGLLGPLLVEHGKVSVSELRELLLALQVCDPLLEVVHRCGQRAGLAAVLGRDVGAGHQLGVLHRAPRARLLVGRQHVVAGRVADRVEAAGQAVGGAVQQGVADLVGRKVPVPAGGSARVPPRTRRGRPRVGGGARRRPRLHLPAA